MAVFFKIKLQGIIYMQVFYTEEVKMKFIIIIENVISTAAVCYLLYHFNFKLFVIASIFYILNIVKYSVYCNMSDKGDVQRG